LTIDLRSFDKILSKLLKSIVKQSTESCSKGKTYVDRCLSSSGSQKTNDCCIKPLQSFSHSNDFLFFTYRDFPIFEEFLIKEFNLFTFFEKLVVGN